MTLSSCEKKEYVIPNRTILVNLSSGNWTTSPGGCAAGGLVNPGGESRGDSPGGDRDPGDPGGSGGWIGGWDLGVPLPDAVRR